MGAKFTGLREFGRKLEKLPAAAKAEIRQGLEESADRVVGLARSLAPRDEGDLVSSIRREAGDHDLQVKVKAGGPLTQRPVREGVTAPTFDYAAKIEHEEQPFFFPAVRALKTTTRRRMGKALRAAVQRVMRHGS